MKDICFMCNEEKNLTKEHIIPHFLGGELQVKIYCKECNSELGLRLDARLYKQFGRYSTLLNIKRSRDDKIIPFDLVDTKTGTELIYDGRKLFRKRPVVKIEQKRDSSKYIEIIGRSNDDLQEIAKGLSEKHNLKYEEFKFSNATSENVSTEYVLDVSAPEILRAVAKIAFGFSCLKLPKQVVDENLSKIKSYIKNEYEGNFVSLNYKNTDFMTDNKRPLHKVHLSFNKQDKLIIGYVALFGVFRYTVLLSDTFKSDIDWPSVDYSYNPITKKQVISPNLFLAPRISKADVISPQQTAKQVIECLNRGMKIISEYSGVDTKIELTDLD